MVIPIVGFVGFIAATLTIGLLLGYMAARAFIEHSITKYWIDSDWILFKGWKRITGRYRATPVEYLEQNLKDSQRLLKKYQEQFITQLQKHDFTNTESTKMVDRLPSNVTPFPKKRK